MNDKKLRSPAEVKAFLDGAQTVSFQIEKASRHEWMTSFLRESHYFELKKKEKSIMREYMLKITNYSRSQLNDLIKQYKAQGRIGSHAFTKKKFNRQYKNGDVLLLIEMDKEHEDLSGLLTKKLLERAYKIFNDKRYEKISMISGAHIYNLRQSDFYKHQRIKIEKTKRSTVPIGIRKKPIPNGAPGYIRIDTVHQGDLDKKKGVYHINAVDEVTQFEVVCSVEKITEQYLIPVLEELLSSFPFKIRGFHSDNGSEYVNRPTAKLLNKLNIEFTKSRARRSNDNALAESKNGSIVRKVLGYVHIPQKYAPLINEFNKKYWVPYLNYHRPCFFAREKVDEKGKIKKIYLYEDVMTPYDKLKSISKAQQYLKEGVTFEALDRESIKMTDLEAAKKMREEKLNLFKKIASDEKESVDEMCTA